MTCSDFRDWSAVRDSMPGSDGPVLRIRGSCTCTSTGHRVSLKPDNEGIINDPDVQVFRVHVEEPPTGGSKMTDEPVTYDGPADRSASKVVIRVRDQEPVTVEIEDVS
jgi:hypothetical protein